MRIFIATLSAIFTAAIVMACGAGGGSGAILPVATPPSAPINPNATAGNGQGTVTFSAPASDGGSAISGYTVTSNPPGGIDSNAGTSALTHLISGLANGISYTFTVTATNSVGVSPPSGASPSVIPANPVWMAAATLGTARFRHTATLLTSGKVLVGGGVLGFFNAQGNVFSDLASAELYDPSTHTWTPAGTFAEPRYSHTATLLPNGKVLVAGGAFNYCRCNVLSYRSSAELYDPLSNTWAIVGVLATARSSHTATLLPNGKVLVAGGNGTAGPLANAELYDPSSNKWTPAGVLATARSSHTATLLPNGKVLIAGGNGSAGPLTSAELYDPSTNTWALAGALAAARGSHTATLLPNGKVLVAGGFQSNFNLASAELYDPSLNAWTSAGTFSWPRYSHTATLLPSGKVLVAGGHYYDAHLGGDLASAEVYDSAINTWASTGAAAIPRSAHSATLLLNGEVLIAGGAYSNLSTESIASTELFGEAAKP